GECNFCRVQLSHTRILMLLVCRNIGARVTLFVIYSRSRRWLALHIVQRGHNREPCFCGIEGIDPLEDESISGLQLTLNRS
ncbi:MAG: hypothetical protein MN733_08465, partial [Nitrososphaera sp.]|nr:hypothetical protein [Nitrososphaera sp.]